MAGLEPQPLGSNPALKHPIILFPMSVPSYSCSLCRKTAEKQQTDGVVGALLPVIPLSSAMPRDWVGLCVSGHRTPCPSVSGGASCGHAWRKEGSSLCDRGKMFTIEGLWSKTKSTGHGLGLGFTLSN